MPFSINSSLKFAGSKKEMNLQDLTYILERQRNNSSTKVMLHLTGLSFVNNLMIIIKSLRVFG